MSGPGQREADGARRLTATLTVLPLTFDRVGLGIRQGDRPVKIGSLDEAFAAFAPTLHLGPDPTIDAAVVERALVFTCLQDFAPDVWRDQLSGFSETALDALAEEIQPVRRSWHLLDGFYRNANYPILLGAPELYVFNADMRAITGESDDPTCDIIDKYVYDRCNSPSNDPLFALVLPGFLSPTSRARMEQIACDAGVVLISDLDNVPNCRTLLEELTAGAAKYAFLSEPEPPGLDAMYVCGHVALTEDPVTPHPEARADPEKLWAPCSLALAGALLQADRIPYEQRIPSPYYSRFSFGPLTKVLRGSVEPRPKQRRQLVTTRQWFIMMLNPDNELEICGADEARCSPAEMRRYLSLRRIVLYLQRRVIAYLRSVTPQKISREFAATMVINPVWDLLDDAKHGGLFWNWSQDYNIERVEFGALELTYEIYVREGEPFESFTIDVAAILAERHAQRGDA